jgi:hypothetical protein
MGEDLHRVLERLAEEAGANLMYDANISGEVYAELRDVTLEQALRIILAGSPYVVKKMPGGYAIIQRAESPSQPAGAEKYVIEVRTRLLRVDAELIDALRQGRPIDGITTEEEIQALHTLGAAISEDRWIAVDDVQRQLLMRIAQNSPSARMLASPHVTVLPGESATICTGRAVSYTARYEEPNDPAGRPIPKEEIIEVGVVQDITPSLLAEARIVLAGSLTTTHLGGFEQRAYRNGYQYQVPQLEVCEILLEDVSFDSGQTILAFRPAVKWPLARDDAPEKDEAKPLLALVTATTTVPVRTTPPIIQRQGASMGGMGAFRPQTPPPQD